MKNKSLIFETPEMFAYLKEHPNASFIRLSNDRRVAIYQGILRYTFTIDLLSEFPKEISLEEKWELLPQTYMFEDALKYFREGKTIFCFRGQICSRSTGCFFNGGDNPTTYSLNHICVNPGLTEKIWVVED